MGDFYKILVRNNVVFSENEKFTSTKHTKFPFLFLVFFTEHLKN